MNLEQTSVKEKEAPENGALHTSPETFPSVRYFQVHFEHIEGLIAELRLALDVVKEELAELRNNTGLGGFAPREAAEDPVDERAALCSSVNTGRRRRN